MLYFGKWERNITLGGDAWGYYVYLPALIIYQDLGQLQEPIHIREQLHPGTTSHEADGLLRVGEAPAAGRNNLIKYTYGVSLLHLPAFAIAHLFSSLSGKFVATGYSQPYLLAIYFSSILYILLGLWFCGKVLLHRFSRPTTLLVLGILAIGTNLFYFGTINNGLAHPLLFFLWALLIYLTENYYTTPRLRTFFLIGATVGLITVIRPVECISIAIPLFWGLSKANPFSARVAHFQKHFRHLIGGAVGGILLILPQLLYWKFASGQWVYYSYPGESFDFLHPQIWKGMFGFLNGWLVYTPVLFLAIIGINQSIRKKQQNRLLILILVILHIYITYSWWNWYYINGFGSRPMVDIYALLAIPLAFFLDSIKTNWKKGLLLSFICATIFLNLFQTWQQWKGILWSEAANKAYYIQAFGETSFNKPLSAALDSKRYQPSGLQINKRIFRTDFEGPDSDLPNKYAFSESHSYLISNAYQHDPAAWSIPYEAFEIATEKPEYILVRVQVYVARQIPEFYLADGLILEWVRNGKGYGSKRIRLHNKTGDPGEFTIWSGKAGQWYPAEIYLPIDYRFREGDSFRIFPEHYSDEFEVYIDDLEVFLIR